jgi:hypothetical protein
MEEWNAGIVEYWNVGIPVLQLNMQYYCRSVGKRQYLGF